ncbi:MAG: hypothetical protein CM1200mP16_10050 [Nitrospina sp.]|nr:MAG: hypothetical protein CM1200mP16_10050 [Nitrospina sp.]
MDTSKAQPIHRIRQILDLSQVSGQLIFFVFDLLKKHGGSVANVLYSNDSALLYRAPFDLYF